MQNTTEQKAIEFVLAFEKNKGRNPEDVSKKKCGFDILSSGRRIEVKGTSSDKPPFVIFNQYNFGALQKENNFYLYIVCNLKEKPKLIILDKNEVLKRAKFTYSWEIPLRKIDF